MDNKKQTINKEILEEEYMLGKEYYNKILDVAEEEKTKKYK